MVKGTVSRRQRKAQVPVAVGRGSGRRKSVFQIPVSRSDGNVSAALRPFFPRLAELSGTPSPNGYGDLWSQFYLLDNGARLGSSERSYLERWFTPPVGMFTKWNLSPQGARQIREAIKDMVLSLREEDYLDLPPIIDNFIRCTLSPAAMATYKEMAREYVAEVKGQKLTAVNAGVLDGKLLQLANGACYTGEDKKWVVFHDEKVLALDETLEAMPGKALIAYGYQHDLARISMWSRSTLRKRMEELGRFLNPMPVFDAWAKGEIDWGILHPASAGHGLNDMYKAGCEDIIHFGLTNNLEWYQQVNARIGGGHRRAWQKHPRPSYRCRRNAGRRLRPAAARQSPRPRRTDREPCDHHPSVAVDLDRVLVVRVVRRVAIPGIRLCAGHGREDGRGLDDAGRHQEIHQLLLQGVEDGVRQRERVA